MKKKLILAFVFAIIGLIAIAGSSYFAYSYYFVEDNSKSEKIEVIIDEKIDTDGDGLTDIVEIDVYKTNPNKKDTDGDGYSDKIEIDSGYDPLSTPTK